MALTAEEERQYQLLKKEERRLLAEQEGGRLLQTISTRPASAAKPITQPKQNFSLTRLAVGSVQDAWNAVADLDQAWGSAKRKAFKTIGTPEIIYKVIDGTYRRKLISYLTPESKSKENDLGSARIDLVGDSKGTGEQIGRNVLGFVLPFAAAGRVTGAFRTGLSVNSRVSRSVAAGTLVNLTAIDASKNNLANTLRDDFGFDNAALDALAYEEDDSLIEARLKAAISNLPLDIAAEGVFEAGFAAVRAYKAARRVTGEAAAFKEAVKSDIVIKRTIEADKAEPTVAMQASKLIDDAANPQAATPEAGVKVDTEALMAPIAAPTGKPIPEGMVAVKPSQVKPEVISTVEEFVTVIGKAINDVPGNEGGRLEKIAKALVENPHNALDELSIDPVKLDTEIFKDPAKITAMQESLGSLVDEVAAKTGRTGRVVSHAETLKAARVLSASPRVLQKLLENTQGLAGRLTASRIIVGAHAHKLVKSVDDAIAEIEGGARGAAWFKFVDDLSAHNVLLGTLRGAGSEIARALQSLQTTVPVREALDGVVATAKKALAADEVAPVVAGATKKVRAKAPLSAAEREFLTKLADGKVDKDGLKEVASAIGTTAEALANKLGLKWKEIDKIHKAEEVYNDLFKDLSTDAGRLRLLNQLKNAKGDLTALNKYTKARQMTWLNHVNYALVETKGNLFSLGTLGLNVVGGTSVFVLDGISRAFSAAGLTVLSFRNADAALAARKSAYKALAYIHAPAQAFGEAMTNAFQVIKRDLLDESSAWFDAVGATKLAKALQEGSNATGGNITKGVVKEDFQGGRKGIYVSPEAINAIVSKADEWPIGRFGQLGLEWLIRSAALPINTFGAATRLSVSAFINAGDQFVGTMSARIGAQVKAADIAYDEAAEAGLDGKELRMYVNARIMELSDHIVGISDDPFEDGVREVTEQAGLDYAARTTFADGLETASARGIAQAFENFTIGGTFIMPFPRTPLRVMERTIIDYSPLGFLKDRVRKAWIEGDIEVRGELAARYTLATALVSIVWMMTSDRTIVGVDGGYKNSARYERPSYSIKIGDDVYEFARLDPLGTVIGLVADIRQAMDAKKDGRRDIEEGGVLAAAGDLAGDVAEAALWSVITNILSKSWMESLEELVAVAKVDNPEDGGEAAKAFFDGLAARFVPASGVQRQFEKWDDGIVRQSRGVYEGWLKASIGADELPEKLDPMFGRPVKVLGMDRAIGLKGGPVEVTKVTQELARLNFDITPPKWKQRGVELNSVQMNRLLQLRGHETVDGIGTLEDKITSLIDDPEWDTLVDEEKIELIKKAAEPHTKLAVDQLLREDDDFAYKALQAETRKTYKLEGRSRKEADEVTKQFALEIGLKPPE